jgi:hypothetical protein
MGDAPESKRANPLATGIGLAKDAFALLRDFTLFAIAVLLLLFPTKFNAILADAGFVEGSFAGMKWQRQFDGTNTVLATTKEAIARLEGQNAILLKALKSKAATSDAKQREELARLESLNQEASDAAAQVQASVGATLASNEPLLAKARAVTPVVAPPSPAFCYQEDNLQPGPQRYSVHCHATQEKCKTARGPNPRTKQSACTQVDLSGAQWSPRHPGWMGSWFEFRSDAFGAPFPALPG